MKPDDSTDEAYVNAAKRQPAVSWLAMLLLAALIVGAALTTWKWREATNALAEAQQEAKSRVGINEFFIEDLLGQAHSNSQTDPDIKLRTVLRRSSKNVGKRFEDDPETEAEVRFQVGRVLYGLAEHRDALEHFREAYEIRTKLFGEEHAETMQVLFRVGKAEKGLGNHEVAIEIFDRVADYYRKNTNPDTANLFDAMIMKSGSLSSLGRHAEAEKVAVEFVDFAHDDPDLDIKNGMEQLAKTLYDQKKYAACETVIIGRLNMPDKSSQK